MKYYICIVFATLSCIVNAQSENALNNNLTSPKQLIDSNSREFKQAFKKLNLIEDNVTNERYLFDRRTKHTDLIDNGLFASIKVIGNKSVLVLTVYHIPGKTMVTKDLYNKRGLYIGTTRSYVNEPRKTITKIIINDGSMPNEFVGIKKFTNITRVYHDFDFSKENNEYKILKRICTNQKATIRFYFGENDKLDYELSRREISEIESVVNFWEIINGIK